MFAVYASALMSISACNPPQPDAIKVLDEAADLLQKHSLGSARVDWTRDVAAAKNRLGVNPRRSDLESAVFDLIIKTGENHTLYIYPEQYAKAQSALDGQTSDIVHITRDHGYPVIAVKSYAVLNERQSAADSKHADQFVKAALAQQKCGFIADLSKNSGGNLYPMLSALSSILPNRVLAKQVYRTGSIDDISVVTRHSEPKYDSYPIAIIIGAKTASSGEFLSVALRSLPRSRTFGGTTAGYTTGNGVFPLSNGAALAITTTRLSTASGNIVYGPLSPDVHTTDRTAAFIEAQKWLDKECNGR
jgi:C-terminal processing protease CtpA/Prc